MCIISTLFKYHKKSLENLLIPYQAVGDVAASCVLVLAPHPDDEVFGCGGAIMRHIEKHVPVHVIIITDGVHGIDPSEAAEYIRQRRDESVAAAAILGYGTPEFWQQPDRGLFYGEKLIGEISAAIQSKQADLVYAPSVYEIHPDHRALGMATIEAARRCNKPVQLALYEIGQPFQPNLLLDISDLAERKMEAMRCFASQNAKQRYDLDIAALNRYRTYTLPTKVNAAEAYILTDTQTLASDPLKLYQSEHARQQAKGLPIDTSDLPLVSVIIRSMDRDTLSDALDSVALQTYPNIEVVLVNAKGQGHRSVEDWCGRFPLRMTTNDEPLGRSKAANAGLDAAQGEFLIFLDDDDLFDSDHIVNLIETLKNSKNCFAAYAGVRVESNAGATSGAFNQNYIPGRLMAGNFIPIHAVLFKRSLIAQDCRFDEALDCYEDWDFWLQVARKTDFTHTTKITAVYRTQLGNSRMSQPSAHNLQLQRSFRLKVWKKWWQKWTPIDFDCLVTGFYRQLDQVASEREEQIASLNQWVSEREEQIASLNHAVFERDEQIKQLHSSISEIFDSKSWKLTAPARFLSHTTRKTLQHARPISHLIFQYYRRESGLKLFQRIFSIVRNEGLYGIKRRLKAVHVNHQSNAVALKARPTARLKKHHYLPLSSVDITKYDYFFFDVFDTAIIRFFQKPTDLFEYISFKNANPDFHLRRVQRETTTRKRYQDKKEISIFQIYDGLPSDSINEEIAAERKFCVAHPDVYHFYLKLLNAGKKIYFVSDMYLDKETISSILKENGYHSYEDIYVSSEDDLIKGDGSRFAWLKNNIPASIDTAIHIGDNHVSDFLQPKAHGFDALHFMESSAYYQCDPFLYSKIEFLNSNHSLGLSFLTATFRYWKSSFHDQPPDYWRQFGFFYGGALISAFCGFVHEQLSRKKLSCNKIYFLARDGDIMSQVYRLLYDDVNDAEAVYLLASRRCMLFPSFKSLTHADDKEALKLFIEPLGNTSAEDVLDRFGYPDLGNLKADLKNIDPDPGKWSERDICACILKNKQPIMEKVVSERGILLDYLSEMGCFDQDDIVIVDVGWGGSIQNSLVKLLKLWGYSEKRLHGIYLGVNDCVAYQENKTGFLFEGDQSKFFEYLNLIELITSSPQNGVVRINRVNGHFVPVAGAISEHEKKRQSISVDIQKGILDFAHLIKERNLDNPKFINPNDFRILFESLRDFSSKEDIAQFGQLKHSVAIGNSYTHPVLNLNPPCIYDIKLVTVFINLEMYHRFFTANANVTYYELIGIDNRSFNRGLPKIYNEVIERYINDDCWLFFTHEDFEIKRDLSVIDSLDSGSVYGTFGINFEHDAPVGYGNHVCSNKDGSSPVDVGKEILDAVKVQTLDCQSILVHTSLLKQYPLLRFDEQLTFDLYAEDFSINAQEKHGIDVKVFPLKFQHYSHGKVTAMYHEGLRYLARKYPSVAVAGSCSFIGGRANELEKKFTYDIPANPSSH